MGIIKPTDDGYYPMNLGAVSVSNKGGIFYVVNQAVKDLISKTSYAKKLEYMGRLRAEVEHPAYLSGMTKEAFMERWGYIDTNNVCAAIRKTSYKESKDDKGNPIILIQGEVKPSGVKIEALRTSIKNPDENVDFSTRHFCNEGTDSEGNPIRLLKQIVTYDLVGEGGIEIANKYMTAACESVMGHCSVSMEIFKSDVQRYSKLVEENGISAGGENSSGTIFIKDEFFDDWSQIDNIKLGANAW